MNALRVIDGKPVYFEDILELILEWVPGARTEIELMITYSVRISFEEETKDLPEGEGILPTGLGSKGFILTGQDALSFFDKYRILAKKQGV